MNIVKSKGIEVKRIAGNDRIETSEEVAKETWDKMYKFAKYALR